MKYSLTRLPSKLSLLTVPMPASESATLTVWVKTGSRNEQKDKLGISHFLEHMVFKGSKKFPTMKQLFEAFDEMGAEHNAGTTKEWTNFYVKLPVTDIERGFEILSDVVINPLLDAEELKKERNVIFEEMKMIEDIPMRNIGDIFEELIYKGSTLAEDIIGNHESMNSITQQDFLDYRKVHYHADNILISVAGGVKPKKISELSEKYFADIDPTSTTFKGISFKGEQDSPQVKIKEKKTDQAHLILGFKSEGRGYEGKFIQAVLSGILGGGASSRLWTEVREKRGLAYAVSGSMDRYSDVGYFGVYAGTDIEKSYEAIKVILDQCYGIADKSIRITDKELKKVKGFLKGHVALQLEDSNFANDFFSEQALFDKQIYTPEEIFAKVDAVTADQVYAEAAKLFQRSRLSLAIIGPFKEKEKFVGIINK